MLTTRPAQPQYGETFHNGSLTVLLDRLGAEGVRHVYLDGGATVRQGLIAGVVDHLTLSWLPVMIGSGIPLFDRTLPEKQMKLTASRTFTNGMVQVTYDIP